MSEPWFDGPTAGLVGAIVGSAAGILGALYGGVGCGYFVTRGRAKPWVLGAHCAIIGFGLALVAVGVVALAGGQPYHVWYPFLQPGAILALLFGALLPVVRHQYRRAEERKVAAHDLT